MYCTSSIRSTPAQLAITLIVKKTMTFSILIFERYKNNFINSILKIGQCFIITVIVRLNS